jgi:DNA-binding transcriptional LysR family regulator
MELRDLQCFLAVAEELSFTKAARRLRVAQPALSLRIKQFEQELGAALFNRTKRKVELSDAGAAMEPRARQILAASHDAASAVRMIAAGQSGIIKIGAYYSAIYTVLPQIIRRFALEYPHVEIQIKELIVTEQLKLLRQGEIDVGIVRLERADPDIRVLPLLKEDFVCALPIDHALASRKKVSLRDLVKESIITLDPQFNADFYTAILAAFTVRGLSPRIINKAPDMHLVLGLVSAGLGVSLVPSSIAHINHKYIVFKNLTDKLPEMTIQLAWLGQNGSPIVSHFAEKASEIYKVRPRGKASAGALL